MHITVSRTNILNAVQRCQNVVERRHTVPILSNILLRAEEGSLTATANDLEVGIRACVEANVSEPGAITVGARKLFDVIKELDADADVELRLDEGFLRIACGRARFRLATMPADEFPDLQEDDEGASIRLDGADLAAMIAATGFAMSTDETRKYLTGTLFELDGQGRLNLVATDGHRLALTRRMLEQAADSRQSIVPRKAVVEIRKLCEDEPGQVELRIGERQILLKSDGCTLTSKLIDARFPNYGDVIPTDNPQIAVASRTELDRILRRTMIVANEFTHDVRLLLRPGEMTVSAHNTDQEQAEESLALDYSGPETEIGFNARYIRDVLGVMHGDAVRMHFRDGLSPVLLDEGEDAAALFVIMPMRI
jgi:DNA polymerase-3 subunit beta